MLGFRVDSKLALILLPVVVLAGCTGTTHLGGEPVNNSTAPTITSQPVSQNVTAGEAATFAVAASGTGPLTYQWQKNGADISGANSSSYTTPPVATADSGVSYRARVSNSSGTATSSAATLTVTESAVAPAITTQPASQSVALGQPAVFTVTAKGSDPLSYQWQKNGVDINGANSSTYTTPPTTAADSGSTYHAVVSNKAGKATSHGASLTVNEVAPSITTQPTSEMVTAGQTATFSVAADGTAPLSYQWQKNGKNIGGATSPTYITPKTTTSDSGSSYRAVVSNSAGSVTSNAATLTVSAAAVAPSITLQPANQTVTAGQTATFSVAANGTAPLSYQWQKNGANINGATSPTYTTPATTTSDSGSTYRAVVSNSSGSVTSGAATLTVNAAAVAPSITLQPTSQTVTAGQTATFAVAATGTAPLSYQWQKNGANISGATSPTYTTPATASSDSGSTFRAVVSNSTGSVTSSAATLTVSAAAVAPSITLQPANQTVTAGQTATFSVAANGTAPLSYQWQKNGNNISGATSPTYTTPATKTNDSGDSYRAVVSNSAGSATSGAATLTVSAAAVAPSITLQPASQTVTAGQTATFSVAATGTAPLNYQWQKNGANISGATSSTYTTPATTTGDSGNAYRVVVSNSAGSATSNAATLTVNAAAVAPSIATQPASLTVTLGQVAVFAVVANGTAPLGYQWQKNGANISGATSSTYTTPATTTNDSGNAYRVVVSNSAGSVMSNTATLTVNDPAAAPSITTQPADQTVTAGQTATFSVGASGTAPLSYQWQKNGSDISGATSATYTTPATATSDSGSTYRVVVSNSAGSITSNAATLTVNAGSGLRTYSTNFSLTENPISEGGIWINGETTGLDWSNVQTNGGIAFGTESGFGSYDDSTAVLSGSWNPDQMAQATVHTVNQNSAIFEEVELRLRTTITAHSITGYEINFRCTTDGSQYVQVVRWNGPFGSFSYVTANTGPGLRDGDVVKATISGSTITVYINGNQIVQGSDGTFKSGSPGIGFYLEDASGVNSDFGFTSFTASELGAASAAVTPTAQVRVSANSLTSSLTETKSLALAPAASSSSSVNVLTYHNDNARTGQNLQETVLMPANVNSASFGKKGVLPVDGAVDAQPLYVGNRSVGGRLRNVVLVATERDLVYAFDADTLAMLWRTSLLGPTETPSDDRGCAEISPEIGITATPVVDLNAGPNGTIFVVAMSKDAGGNYYQRLHALDLGTGSPQSGSPSTIRATFTNSAGHFVFDPSQYKERAGLLLLNGVVYLSWASHCDRLPNNGWVMGYSETSLKQLSAFNLTPGGSSGTVSMSGAGLAADGSGNIYFATGSGTFDTVLDSHGLPAKGDYGNALVKLSTRSNSLGVSDYFAAHNTEAESNSSQDLGSGGVLLLPDLADYAGNTWHLALGAGKDSHIYVANRESMGKFNPSSDDALFQKIDSGALGGAIWGMPAYFNQTVYYGAANDTLKAFPIRNARLVTPASSQSGTIFAGRGTTPSISANGTSNGIVWATESNGGNGVLRAYDAGDLARELYNSTRAGSRDQFEAGSAAPLIANGKVYLGTPSGVIVFGLLN